MMNTASPAQTNPDDGGIVQGENCQLSLVGWLRADVEKLERFAGELDEMVERLERIRD